MGDLMVAIWLCCSTMLEIGFGRKIFRSCSSRKFHEQKQKEDSSEEMLDRGNHEKLVDVIRAFTTSFRSPRDIGQLHSLLVIFGFACDFSAMPDVQRTCAGKLLQFSAGVLL